MTPLTLLIGIFAIAASPVICSAAVVIVAGWHEAMRWLERA